MTISMYQASVPVYLQMLGSISKVLDKAAEFAEAKKIDPAALLATRLYPDMFPLVRQAQNMTDHATRGCARLSGVEPMPFPDTETTFAELQARFAKATDYVKSFKADQIDGQEEREVVLKTPRGDFKFTGQQYLLHFSLPNLFFHSTATYAILRSVGVEVGKLDFIGGLPK